MNELLLTILIFSGLQIINVVLNTAKTLIMAKQDNVHYSVLINAITFGFYTAIVKQIALLDLSLTITVVVITNIIGVYLTYWIIGKIKKDELWKIEIFTPEFIDSYIVLHQLEDNGIEVRRDGTKLLTVFCYTQEESTIVKQILAHENEENDRPIKYNITIINKEL